MRDAEIRDPNWLKLQLLFSISFTYLSEGYNYLIGCMNFWHFKRLGHQAGDHSTGAAVSGAEQQHETRSETAAGIHPRIYGWRGGAQKVPIQSTTCRETK